MTELDILRSQVNTQQQQMLQEIWLYYQKEKKWIPIRLMHSKFESKELVRNELQRLGGSIVFEITVNGNYCYGLSLLGLLLSYSGEQIEELIITYLNIVKAMIKADPLLTIVKSIDLNSRFRINTSELELLEFPLFYFSSPFAAGGSYGSGHWEAGIPASIEDIPEDTKSYVHKIVMINYDKNVPVSEAERSSYLWSSKKGPDEDIFFFISDEIIKSIVAQDWQEAKICFNSKAWKSCIISCGSTLEAILLDNLLHDPDKAIEALIKVRYGHEPERNLLKWDLNDLVDVSKEIGLIGEASSHLGHALRLHRNLVHPGRQVKERIVITEGDAQISINTVEKCISDLAKKCSNK